jgi:hypothetical protein
MLEELSREALLSGRQLSAAMESVEQSRVQNLQE